MQGHLQELDVWIMTNRMMRGIFLRLPGINLEWVLDRQGI